MKKNRSILGRNIFLSDGRIVFLGRFEDSDEWGLAFRNSDGEDKYWSLSKEVAKALFTLVHDRNSLDWHEDFPHKKIWDLVEEDKEMP